MDDRPETPISYVEAPGTSNSISKEAASAADDLDAFLAESAARLKFKSALREKNKEAATNRPEESFFSRLDSSLKKNTAFVKKVRTLTEGQRDALLKEFLGLNLSKYVAEIASAVVEAKLKMSDVSVSVELCSAVYQRYADFSPLLIDQFKKVLPRKKDDKIASPSKLRVDVRLVSDLVSVGVLPEKEGLQLLGGCLAFLVNTDKEEHNNCAILISFCKACGDEYAGLLSRKYRQLATQHGRTVQLPTVFSADRQKTVYNLLQDYYNSLCAHVVRLNKDMARQERHNYKLLHTRGEVYQEQQQALDDAVATFEKFHQNALTLADLLDVDGPSLPNVKLTDVDEVENGMRTATSDADAKGEVTDGSGPWEDEDTRIFYEDLPELKIMLPGILFKESEKPTLPLLEEQVAAGEDIEETVEAESSIDTNPLGEKGPVAEQTPTEKDGSTAAPEVEEAEDTADGKSVEGSTLKLMLEVFVSNLPNLINRDLIDKAAIDFVTNLNTRINRKKLVRALFNVPRTRLDLLPFYARMVAVLNPVMPDVGTELVQMLIQEFRFQLRKKDQQFVESKVKVIRFLGELVKFKICPKSEILHCLKMLLFDFRHHNIDMTCALLEVCGYFLYHSPVSGLRTKILLDTMMRKKQAAHLNQRYELMIENTYYQVNPPPASAVQKIERSPLEEYVRFLLFKELSKSNVEKILKQIRKLDWNNASSFELVIACLSSPWEVRYNCIQCLASLLAGLMWYYEEVGIRVIDSVLEDIRLGLEVNHSKINQRRICCMKYLGELYNYRCVDSNIIFSVLYSQITFGVVKGASEIDPIENLFRIRLCCILLDTCGHFFDRGSSRRKLDCFLTYFQQYFLQKKCSNFWDTSAIAASVERRFPLEIDNIFRETVECLRPHFVLVETLEVADKAVEKLVEEYKEKVESVLKFLQTGDGDAGALEFEDEKDLEIISEDAENNNESQSMELGESQNSGTQERLYAHMSDEYGEMLTDEREENVTVHMRQTQQPPEDEDFLSAFDKIVAESITQRMQDSAKIPQADFGVPANVKVKSRAHFENDVAEEDSFEEDNSTVNFVVMLKGKGNKPAFRNLKVPSTSDLAQNIRSQEEAEQREKERVKKLTLHMTERMEEEERVTTEQNLRAQFFDDSQYTERHGPGQQQKFSHPKGAPNPDQIFSNRWR